MYLYVELSGTVFWSQDGPSDGDRILIGMEHLRVFANHGGTFVEAVVSCDGKMAFVDLTKGRRKKDRGTEEVYTFHNEDANALSSERWEDVPPRIPIGPPGMKSPP